MKKIWKQCWYDFRLWFDGQWKCAWELLQAALITFVQACFEWLKTIVGGVFAGFWKLVVLPIGKWCHNKIVEWIEKI